MQNIVIIGIDLAGKPKNPSGWALWKGKRVETNLIYTNDEILERITHNNPTIIAIDAPFFLPKEGVPRKVDTEMIRRGYNVFPPCLPALKMLTVRAMKLNKLIAKKGYKAIEVHPTSTCKALNMPLKNPEETQKILQSMGLEGDLITRAFKSHEIDAVTAALTVYLHVEGQTEAIRGGKGRIIIPRKQDWRTLEI